MKNANAGKPQGKEEVGLKDLKYFKGTKEFLQSDKPEKKFSWES